MALFNYDYLKSKMIPSTESYDYLEKHAYLTESKSIEPYTLRDKEFDIFLSHSYADREIIPALKLELESFGYKVYVDWIDDHLLNRDNVNKETAKILQVRMRQSKCLVYATSKNSKVSRWMPWELGYFDGIRDKMVAILPIVKDEIRDGYFKGEEYLGLYFYIDKAPIQGKEKAELWVNEDTSTYVNFAQWLDGQKPYKRN